MFSHNVSRDTSLTLTRKGRLVFIGFPVLGVFLVILIFLIAGLCAPISQASRDRSEVVSVHHGQTLWSIAQSLCLKRDVQEIIEELKKLNHLKNSSLYNGQKLKVPSE